MKVISPQQREATMNEKEQQQRERAYKIWEDEGRPEGAHEDHWRRAEEQHELDEQASDDVTKVNQEADDEFARDDTDLEDAPKIRPPSTFSPD
jgi:hypothetical protein